MLLLLPLASAGHDNQVCKEEGLNVQCNEFGRIAMENQRDVRGEPITVSTELRIDETYADSGARWVMFSVRHDDPTGNSPVSLKLASFKGPDGDLFVTRTDHDVPNEMNLWVHVVDVPEGKPLTLEMDVGVADRGAFELETLVMPFDRGYEPLKESNGDDISLYASTLLGVNEETALPGEGGGSFLTGLRTPGFTFVPFVVAALAALVIVGRGRRR